MSSTSGMASEVKKDSKGFYTLDKNGYRRKLVEVKCVMCPKIRYLRPSKVTSHCRQCAYVVNAFRINSYIKRPNRNSKGQYCKE